MGTVIPPVVDPDLTVTGRDRFGGGDSGVRSERLSVKYQAVKDIYVDKILTQAQFVYSLFEPGTNCPIIKIRATGIG